MRGIVIHLVAVSVGIAGGCAAGRLPNAAGLDVIVRSSDGAVPADADGARLIGATTGCIAEFVRPVASGAFVVRLWPTERAPDARKCLLQLKAMPGVQYAEPDAAMKPL